MKTYVFPGQGSQTKGMGQDLFDEFPDITKKADKILGYSIKELCVQDPDQNLNRTQYTQPALYVVNALSYEKKIKETGSKPDFLAGHSLGEYNALCAAEVFSFEDGLKLVKKRSELMSQADKGAMAAIIKLSEKEIKEILQEAKLTTIDIANYKSPSQIVISGLEEDLQKSQPYFEKAKGLFIPLKTSGAFHSRYMKEAEANFSKHLKKIKFSNPKIPVLSNVTARPYEPKKFVENLAKQISNSVRWTDTIQFLLEQGGMEFEEMGVGDVLTKLINAIQKESVSAKTTQAEKKVSPAEKKSETSMKSTGKEDAPLSKETAKSTSSKAKSTSKKEESLSAQELVEQWNKNYPVGTKVLSDYYESELETRTEAMILFGHRAAVYMKGYNGYFDLREVNAVAK
jgi:malonyl CoA-acyl carrier protein transacylase